MENNSLKILERNTRLYDALKEENDDIYKNDIINEILEINQPLIKRLANKIPFREYSGCDFDDACSVCNMAFMVTLRDFAEKDKDFNGYLFTAASNLAKRMLYNQYKNNTDCGTYEGMLKQAKAGKRIKNASYDAIVEETGELQGMSGVTEDAFALITKNDRLKTKVNLISKLAEVISSDILNNDERELIEKAFVLNLSNRKIAEELGVSHTTLNKKIKGVKEKIALELDTYLEGFEIEEILYN